MFTGGRKYGLSKLALIVILVIVASAFATVYFATSGSLLGKNSNAISIEALSVNSSDTNLTATANVRNVSALAGMTLFINGTYVGSYNYTEGCCMRIMREWGNGTSSYYFTATPSWMPMMSRWDWRDYGGTTMMGGHYRSYTITMMASFANGDTSNSTVTIVPNQQKTGWGCR